MNSFFDLKKKNFEKIVSSLNRWVSTFGHFEKKIPIADFYISRKIKNKKTTYIKGIRFKMWTPWKRYLKI